MKTETFKEAFLVKLIGKMLLKTGQTKTVKVPRDNKPKRPSLSHLCQLNKIS